MDIQNGRLDFLVQKMTETSERLISVVEKIDHLTNNQIPLLLNKMDNVANKMDNVANKIDRVYDNMLKVLEYVRESCQNSNRNGSGWAEWMFRIIQILILALLATVGIKLYTMPAS